MLEHLKKEAARQIQNIEDHLQDRNNPEVQEEFMLHHAPDIKYLLRQFLVELEKMQRQAA